MILYWAGLLLRPRRAQTVCKQVVDMRAEVALLSSNVVLESLEGTGVEAAVGGERYGCRVIVNGASTARISNTAVSGCM